MMTMMDRRQSGGSSGGGVEVEAPVPTSDRPSSPVSFQTVVVLCDLTYEVSATERLTIRADEQLLLLEQTNEDWWMVARSPGVGQHNSQQLKNAENHHHHHTSPFFVPTSYIKLLQPVVNCDSPPPPPPSISTSAEDCDDLRCDELNESKISDEAIGSSRDSMDEIGFEEEEEEAASRSPPPSQQQQQQPSSSSSCPTCDSHRRHHHHHQQQQQLNHNNHHTHNKLQQQPSSRNLEHHIYAEPFAPPFAPMPRKSTTAPNHLRRPEPEYANLCDLERKKKEDGENSKEAVKNRRKQFQQVSSSFKHPPSTAQPRPPSLREENLLKRNLFDGWAEYEDQNGRRFYCHAASGAKSWKPPRRLTAKVVDFQVEEKGNHNFKLDTEAGRKFSLDSSLLAVASSSSSSSHPNRAAETESDYVELGSYHSRSTEALNKLPGGCGGGKTSISPSSSSSSSSATTVEKREQSTQTEVAAAAVVDSEETTTILPAGYRMAMNPLTKEVYLIGLDGHRWFCKRDENGQMFFYEEGQGLLGVTELPAFDDVGGSLSHKDKMRNSKAGIKFLPMQSPSSHHHHDLGLQVNMDRNMKAHSVAMMVPSSRSSPGGGQSSGGGGGPNQSDMIIFNEQFKHTSPFQNVSIIIPSPPTSLNMKDIIYSGTLNRTRTVIAGKVSRRKNWGTSYLVLTKYYLLFFKDQKSAFATSSPIKTEFVLGLLNAAIDWCPNKSSRKNCFQVSTFQDQILLQDDKNDLSAKWFYNIQDAIHKLPSPMQMNASLKSASIIDGLNDKSMPLMKLKRSRSTKQYRPQEEFPPLGGNAKHATLSGYATIANTPMNDKKVKIRERLRQFLRKRPTMENLREKGIIKAENVFGRGLDELCARERETGGGNTVVSIPKFVVQCVEAIEFKDLKADGIYRACGNLSTVQKLRYEINQDQYGGLWREEDVHVLTGLLKMFFREMPEPLFPCDRFESLMKFIAIKNKDAKLDAFRRLVHDLPENNYQTLKFILRHLLRITEFSAENRMSVQNLAIVFGPTLIRPMSDLNNLVLDMMIQMQQSQVIEFLLLEYENTFD